MKLSEAQKKKIRNSARGERCTLQLPCCSGDPEKTVLCHLPSEWRGMGMKSPDIGSAIYADFNCHQQLDKKDSAFWKSGHAHEMILRALQRTIKRMVDKRIITV